MAELEITIATATLSWLPGRYSVELIGWVNRENRNQRANLRQTFHFDVTQALSQQITQPRLTQQAQAVEGADIGVVGLTSKDASLDRINRIRLDY